MPDRRMSDMRPPKFYKRNTSLLPSNFMRTTKNINREASMRTINDDCKSEITAGPADYRAERLIGNSNIANAAIKA